MSLILTDEQQRAIHEAIEPGRVTLVDPSTSAEYVLIRAEVYDRCRALFETGDFDAREAYPLMDAIAASEGWNDPEMDVYDELDPRRGQ